MVESLPKMPVEIRLHLRTGFSELLALDAEKYGVLIDAAVSSVASPKPDVPKELAKTLDLDEDRIGSLLAAAAFTVFAFTKQAETAENFVEGLLRNDILPKEARAKALDFLKVVTDRRVSWEPKLELERLSRSVLPSFVRLGSAVDMRLRFSSGQNKVLGAVPVAVLHIDTDTDSELWMQATEQELKSFIEDLNQVLQQLRAAAEWGGARSL